MPFANTRIKNGTMEDQVMLKTLLAVVMGLVYLTARASQLVAWMSTRKRTAMPYTW
jgi:hypothetical protein